MSARSLLVSALAALFASLGAGAAHAVAPIELELSGVERDRMLASGDERERITAKGDGAELHLRETVECGLKAAHCGQLHHHVAHGDCEESLVSGRLVLPRGALRLTGVGRTCADRHDHELLWVIAHRGTERLRGVHAVLEIRVRKSGERRRSSVDVVSIDTVDVATLAIDREPRARAAEASQACILCELLVGVVHAEQRNGVSDGQQHLSSMARVCTLLPEQWAQPCDDMIEQHGEQIVALAAQGLDAHAVCAVRLGFQSA